MTEIESFSTKHSNNNCSGITIYFCDGIPISTKELARDLVRLAFWNRNLLSNYYFRQSKFNEEIGEDVSSEDYKSSVDELIK